MEDDDDDLYDPADAVPVTQPGDPRRPPTNAPTNDSNDAEEEEEVEEEDDEDDFNIITEAPPDAPPPEVPHPRHANLKADSQRPSSADFSSAPKSQTPTLTPKIDVSAPVPAGTRPVSQKPGSAYPPVHTSTIDVHANPIHPATGKPVLSTDMDIDFPDDDKPWRRPGSDMTDYFNYGFDEFTWASYVLKQQELRREVGDQKRQLDDMQSFLTMGLPPMPGVQPGAGPPASSAPPPMPGIPGMPDMNPDMMQGMLTSMMSQGLDPTSMDPMAFMQHAQAMMGGQSGGGGGQQSQGGFGGHGGHGSHSGHGGHGGQGGGYPRQAVERSWRSWHSGNFSRSFLRSVKNLAPLMDRVLVQRVKPEAKTASGIFLPESSVKEQNEAKVLAVGPGAVDRNGQRVPMGVNAGDRVLIPQFGGSPIKIGEEEYSLFRDSEILAKINE
ncbi:hypothetical protein BJX76DRAFT_363927 [Aspergillus varians]